MRLLSANDRKLWLRYTKAMKRKERQIKISQWTNEVAFFLDGVSFVYKYNPHGDASCNRSRVWRRT